MWIKVPYNDADAFNEQPELLYSIGLDIPELDDVRDVLVYEVIDEFVYVKIGVFNLKNKNRAYPPSEEEIAAWEQFLELYPNWEKIKTFPERDPEVLRNL